MIPVDPHPDGALLHVRVQPSARHGGIVGLHGRVLKVAVTAPAEQGRANAALLDVLADALHVRRSCLEVLAGAAARDKRVLVRGVSPEELHAPMERIAGRKS